VTTADTPVSPARRLGGSILHAQQFGLVVVLLLLGTALTLGAGSHVDPQTNQTVSVLPLTESEVSMSGVNWPLERQNLSPVGMNSISNHAVGEKVEIQVHSGACLCVFHYSHPEFPIWQ